MSNIPSNVPISQLFPLGVPDYSREHCAWQQRLKKEMVNNYKMHYRKGSERVSKMKADDATAYLDRTL